MSKISKDGFEQITVIRNALDSMYDKLDKSLYTKSDKKVKDITKQYKLTNVFESVKDEFETIANIVEEASTWSEVK